MYIDDLVVRDFHHRGEVPAWVMLTKHPEVISVILGSHPSNHTRVYFLHIALELEPSVIARGIHHLIRPNPLKFVSR